MASGGLWGVVVTGGELIPRTGDKDLELVRRGECIWSDSKRDSWLLVVACCTWEEDEQDLLRGVIWSALSSFWLSFSADSSPDAARFLDF